MKIKFLSELFHSYVGFRYLLIGGLNTAFSFSIYSFLVLIGLHYSISNLIALVLGILFSYLTNGKVVFKHISKASFVRYIFLWGFLYLLQISIISLTLSMGGEVILGGFLALIVAVPTSYILQKYFVFHGSYA